MKAIIKAIKLRISNCSDATKESRARKGAYVDCLVLIEKHLKNK